MKLKYLLLAAGMSISLAGCNAIGLNFMVKAEYTVPEGTVDFTPFVECYVLELKDCQGYSDLRLNNLLVLMTPEQKNAIVNTKEEIIEPDENATGEAIAGFKDIQIKLKNASAFGQRITQFSWRDMYEFGYSRVTFMDVNSLSKISQQISIKDYTETPPEIERIVAVNDPEEDSKLYNKYPLYDKDNKRIPRASSVINGSYSGIIFDIKELYVSSEGGA